MAEVLGAVSAAAQLLDIAIDLVRRLRQAYDHKKELKGLLDTHLQELKRIGAFIERLEGEEALQTNPDIAATLDRLGSAERRLLRWLQRVDPGNKSSLKQFAHQLTHGIKDRKDLADLVSELSRAKEDLRTEIHVAHVRLTNNIKDRVIENTRAMQQIDKKFSQMPARSARSQASTPPAGGQSSQGERSTPSEQFPTAPSRTDSGYSTGSSSLTRSSTSGSTDFSGGLTRIVRDNSAREDSMMFNTPFGEDVSRHIQRIEIMNNRTEGRAMMFNHPQNMSVLQSVIELQKMKAQADITASTVRIQEMQLHKKT